MTRPPGGGSGHSMPNAGSSQRTPRAAAGHVRRGHLVEHLGVVRRASGSRGRSRAGTNSAAPLSALSSTPNQRRQRRRVRPQVDDHVEDRAARAAHELGLAVRLGLEVHAAQRPGARVERHVALHDRGVEPARRTRPRRRCARSSRARRSAARARRRSAPGSGVATNFTAGARARACAPRTARPTRGCTPSCSTISSLAGSRAGSARRRAASSRERLRRADRDVRAGQEVALLVRVAVDRVVEEVGADAAVVEQRVALGRRAVADDRACPARLSVDQELEDRRACPRAPARAKSR